MIIERCRELALRAPARVVFPDALDQRVLKAAQYLHQQGLATPILVANPFELRQFALSHGVAMDGLQVIDPHGNLAMREEFAHRWLARAGEKTPPDALEKLTDPLMFAAAMVSAGKADVCIAGNLSSTANVLRAGLRIIGLQPGCKTLSSIFLMLPQYSGPALGFADCSVVPQPTAAQLACDMGGFFLAKELAGGDVAAWLYSGLILGSMMGPTIVFSIPVALGIIEPSDRRYLALGVLAGIVTIPIGCIAGGLVAMYSGVQINGQPVEFTFALILMNMIPVIIVAILVALGLKFIPEKMINGFQIFAKFLVALITLGLAAAVVKFLLGWELIPGLDPIFMAPGDKPGEVMRAIEVIGSISCVLLGAYPMVLLLTRWFEKPLMSVGKVLNMNNIAAAGMVATLANNIPMFGMMKQMDTRGKVINCAFAVSAAFALGDHLGFAAANMNAMIFPMIVGKLIGGVTAIGVAMMLVPKEDATATKTEAEAQS